MRSTLLLLLSQTLALPTTHTDSGFSLGANWWKADDRVNSAKMGGDEYYLTEEFRTQIFEPLVTRIIKSINDLNFKNEAQESFDIGVTIGFTGFVLTATSIALYSMYRNYCKEK